MKDLIMKLKSNGTLKIPGGEIVETYSGSAGRYTGHYRFVFRDPAIEYVPLPGRGGAITILAAMAFSETYGDEKNV